VTIRAAFLDRDGVINARPPEHDYVRDADALVLLPGVAAAVRRLREGGFTPVVVSNQRGVALGLVSVATLRAIEEQIEAAGVSIERFYYCPHDVSDDCVCRKPRPGLLLQAAADLDVDLRRSVMVGDAESDIEAGRAAECVTIRIAPAGTETTADLRADDLPGAVALVVETAGTQAGTTDR
jgi:D-glycero-D-manno-heptose 1,7-bisphosphate phosphatase